MYRGKVDFDFLSPFSLTYYIYRWSILKYICKFFDTFPTKNRVGQP